MKEEILFYDYGAKPVLAVIEGNMSNPAKLFKRACMAAERDGWSGINYDLPEKYLKSYNLTLEKKDVQFIDMEYISSLKVKVCQCRQCTQYISGGCELYKKKANGFESKSVAGCIEGTGKCLLQYNRQFVSGIPFETELQPFEAVQYILTSTATDLLKLKEEIQAYLKQNGIVFEETDQESWRYVRDGY